MRRAKAKGVMRNRRRGDRLRILFVSEYFYPRAAGGEVWSWELCSGLAAAGHEVTVITCRHDHALKEQETVSGVRILRPVGTIRSVGQRIARGIAARRLALHAKRYIDDCRGSIDVVHVMAYALNSYVSAHAEKRGISCVTSVHSYFGRDWREIAPASGVLRWLERRTLESDRSKAMHVPTAYLRQRILADMGKEARKAMAARMVVIHNWLPVALPAPKLLPARTCLYVGSLERVKDPLACITAAKRLKARLIVIGTGSLEGEMRKRAAQERVECEFLGNLPPEETLAYVGGASLVLVPSVTESFSLVALEAVAQGTPVSGTPVGIIPELPGVVAFPPRAFPKRLGADIQQEIRSSFSHARGVRAFEDLYEKIR